MTTPKQVILKEYGEGKNFMTPRIRQTGWLIKDRVVYEIAEGRGITDQRIVGVSLVLVEKDGTTRRLTDYTPELSNSILNATRHFPRIRRQIRAAGLIW